MRLKSIEVSGFRCFGSTPVRCRLAREVTAVVGANASGKTALLHGLAKLFGVTRAQRSIQRSDFHFPSDSDPEDRAPRELFIDVIIEFPELAENNATPETIAPVFRHMLINRAGGAPVCRVRLEARWDDDGTVEGEVSQDLYWVSTLDTEPDDDKKDPVRPADRGLVQMYYTPASRDAGAQIRASTGALAARLLRAIEWSEGTQETVESATGELRDAFDGEDAIRAIGKALRTRWSALHDEAEDTNPKLSLVSRRFEEVVSRIEVIFQQGPDGFERGLETLSDGQQSLFYFALAAAVFDLERNIVTGSVEGFRSEEMRIPALTVFGLEEPENHLSPYYLSRIVGQVRSLVRMGGAQVILTSHSPAVLGRVKPKEVRFCRRDSTTRISSIKSIRLPTDDQEAVKFVRGAMLAFPELYFARFVLLVEGDSERVVLPQLAKQLGLLIDTSFVAIIPLGGRHVQHFWRLLNYLEIPYATLLDLDLGRKGGGFGRVKTVLKRLLEIGVPEDPLLKLGDGSLLSREDLDNMHTWEKPKEVENLMNWVESLRPCGVYFSSPLDFDLMLLQAFPEAYRALIPRRGGPRMTVDEAAPVVLGGAGPGLAMYGGRFAAHSDHLPAYRYHFITRSKPATHMAAITHLDRQAIVGGLPETVTELLNHVVDKLKRD